MILLFVLLIILIIFLIDIDYEKLIQYTHRLDPLTITHFELKGNINIQKFIVLILMNKNAKKPNN